MRLTGKLIEEHKLIKRMIDVLENAANSLDKGRSINPIVFEQAADFIRNFADKFHHAKEEDILFREMVKKGMPEKASPIEAMLIEHDQGRNFVKGMISSTEELKKGKKESAAGIIANARGYIGLLREHIEKEDGILYPLAERMFTEDEKEKQSKAYKKAELKKGGKAALKKYKDIVVNLDKQFGG